jgi:hypothetical protein
VNAPTTWVMITCPQCDQVNRLPAEALLVELDRSGRRTDDVGGVATWACAFCLDLVSRTLGAAGIGWLVAVGVATIDEVTFEPVEALPPSSASARSWTYDDLLDLHELMASGDWLNEIMTAANALNTKAFRGPSGPPRGTSW